MRVSREAAHQTPRPTTRPPTSTAEKATSQAHALGRRRLGATGGASSMTLMTVFTVSAPREEAGIPLRGGGRGGADARRRLVVELGEEAADDVLELADRVGAEQ